MARLEQANEKEMDWIEEMEFDPTSIPVISLRNEINVLNRLRAVVRRRLKMNQRAIEKVLHRVSEQKVVPFSNEYLSLNFAIREQSVVDFWQKATDIILSRVLKRGDMSPDVDDFDSIQEYLDTLLPLLLHIDGQSAEEQDTTEPLGENDHDEL